jgi:hypothetical protein
LPVRFHGQVRIGRRLVEDQQVHGLDGIFGHWGSAEVFLHVVVASLACVPLY